MVKRRDNEDVELYSGGERLRLIEREEVERVAEELVDKLKTMLVEWIAGWSSKLGMLTIVQHYTLCGTIAGTYSLHIPR